MVVVTKKKPNDLKIYKTKQLLENLKNKKGFHTELISLYIPHDRKVSDVTGHLKNEISESQNIKSKLTKKNVLDSIASLLGQLKNIKEVPENGLVMFSGAIPQGNAPGTEKNELYIIDPPDRVKTFNSCGTEKICCGIYQREQKRIYKGIYLRSSRKTFAGWSISAKI
ncbi:MAG: hypothetical protein ACXADU_18255 [Promethearchaeota archaeon]